MSYNEFVKWLIQHGAEISQGRGRHCKKVTFNGKTVPLPHHGAKEIGEGLRKTIIKQLGI